MPLTSSVPPTKSRPPSSYKPPPPVDEVGLQRQQYLGRVKKKAPSTLGQPKEFSKLQADSVTAIHCNRPPRATDAIPVTLLHPVFGKFLDDIETCELTAEDNAVAFNLSRAMAEIYSAEEKRGSTIRDALHEAGITLVGTTIEETKYSTDGDLQYNRHRYMIAELKNEVGSLGAEPNAQAAAYYLESTRKLAPQCPKSPLPCFLLYVFGKLVRPFLSRVTNSIFRSIPWLRRRCVEYSTDCAGPFYRSASSFPPFGHASADYDCAPSRGLEDGHPFTPELL